MLLILYFKFMLWSKFFIKYVFSVEKYVFFMISIGFIENYMLEW